MKLKTLATSIVAVGMIFTSAWTLDTRYAKASEVQAQISVLTVLVLEIKLGDLRRQLFEIQLAAELRELTNLEKMRKQQIEQEIQAIERKMRGNN